MASIRFEWDEAKNLANQRKHGISFEDSREAFFDPLAFTRVDRDKGGELRWQLLGRIMGGSILVVAHVLTEVIESAATLESIRIISARIATPRERRDYEKQDC